MIPQFEYTGFNKWLRKGYKGDKVTIAVIDRLFNVETDTVKELYGDRIISPNRDTRRNDTTSHGSKTCGVIRELPECKIILLSSGMRTFNNLENIVKEYDVDIVTMSISYPSSSNIETIERTVDRLKIKYNVTFVNSAGNSGDISKNSITYPSTSRRWMSIGAAYLSPANDEFQRARYSSIGTHSDAYWQTVELMGITNLSVRDADGRTSNYGGTSCAAPSAAIHIGVIYDYFKKNYNRKPTIKEIRNFLHKNATELINQDGHSYEKGYGLVDLPEQMPKPEDLLDTSRFSDLKDDQTYYLKQLPEGIIQGYEDGTFRPQNPVTRAEMVVMIGRLLEDKNITNTMKNTFDDTQSHWVGEYFYNTPKGLIKGHDNGLFKPDDNITRAEMLTVISRLFSKEILDTMPIPRDVERTGHWVKEYCIQIPRGIVFNPNSNLNLNPDENVSRIEMAAIFARLINLRLIDQEATHF